MILDRAELTELGIWASPSGELHVDDLGEFRQRGKVTIVDPELSQELPDALDRVEIGAVGRQEEQDEIGLLKAAPFGVEGRMVVPGVVEDDDDSTPTAPAALTQSAQERPTGIRIEAAFGLGGDQAAITDPDGPEVADAFSSGRVDQDWIADLRRNPHPAPAPVLLAVDLIQ